MSFLVWGSDVISFLDDSLIVLNSILQYLVPLRNLAELIEMPMEMVMAMTIDYGNYWNKWTMQKDPNYLCCSDGDTRNIQKSKPEELTYQEGNTEKEGAP